jgi:tetratricopeptide (TPR) repeat protein
MMSRVTVRLIAALLAGALLLLGSAIAQEPADREAARQTRREVRRLLRQIGEAADSSSLETVQSLIDSVLELDEDNPDAFWYRGHALARSGDTTQALAALREGADLAPRSSRVRILLARLCIAHGQPEAASQALDEVLAIKPNEAEAFYLKGRLLLAQSDTTQALDALQRALEIQLEVEL